MNNVRKQVAGAANDLYAGKMNYEEFINAIPEEAWEDEEITDLIDMITHEPQVGGFLRSKQG